MGEIKIVKTMTTIETFTVHSGLVSVEFKEIDGKPGGGRLVLVIPGRAPSYLFIKNPEWLEDIASATQEMLEILTKSVSGGNSGEHKGR